MVDLIEGKGILISTSRISKDARTTVERQCIIIYYDALFLDLKSEEIKRGR